MRTKLAALALALLLVPAAGAAVGIKATLKAPTTQPKVDIKWPYSIKVTDLKGKAVRATVTAVVIDPLGTVHPMDYGPTGPPNPGPPKPIKNWPFKGTFRDYMIFPPDARLATQLGGLTLRWTVKAKIGGKTYKKILKRLVKPPVNEAASGGVDVVVDRVTKSFEGGRIVALDGVSLELAAGEFASIVGPSGCGKSTLLNLIGALDVPDSGTIEVGGTDLRHLPDPSRYRASTVGFVFQFHYLIPTLSARENVQVPMIGRGLPRRERVAKADELLRACAIEHRASASPSTLSGGERQRVAIARALTNDPKLLLADEPTGRARLRDRRSDRRAAPAAPRRAGDDDRPRHERRRGRGRCRSHLADPRRPRRGRLGRYSRRSASIGLRLTARHAG